MTEYLQPALPGAAGTVHIVIYDGTAFVLNYLRHRRGVIMDVGEGLKWVAWAIMDQEMRVMAGLTAVANEHTPMMIWTAENIAQAGNPPQQSEGYGNGFVTGYEKLWGLLASRLPTKTADGHEGSHNAPDGQDEEMPPAEFGVMGKRAD